MQKYPTINWSKYQWNVAILEQNQFLDYLINSSLQGVERHFVFSLNDNVVWTANTGYFLSKLEMKDYNIIIDGKSFFDQPLNKKLFKNIW